MMDENRRTTWRPRLVQLPAVGLLSLVIGCGSGESTTNAGRGTADDPPVPMAPALEAPPESQAPTAEFVRAELRRLNPGLSDSAVEIRKAGGEIRAITLFRSGVTDISPIAGLPLRRLDLGGVPVSDLSLLKGMPLQDLILEDTQVADLSPLAGMSLELLHLQHTQVTDLSPLAGMPLAELNLFATPIANENIQVLAELPLKRLWLQATQVSDLSPLAGKRLESFDVQDTPVSDLAVLQGMTSLVRLNIAGSQVTDLTPLAGLRLERLLFTPERIEKGMEIAREMPSLKELGTSFETMQPPDQFWAANAE